jgi:hypothetical protein
MVQTLTCPDRTITRSAGRLALSAGLVLGLASCQIPPGSVAADGAPFVLTTSGGYVLSDAAPGIEVSLGSKLLRRAGEPAGSGSSTRRISNGDVSALARSPLR